LNTKNAAIAETTKRDKVWGIGIDIGDPKATLMRNWNGTNILGWALMVARC